jgi:regulator of sigma E protease
MPILPILVFLAILGVLIFVHEYGHFWAAKRMGVKVLEFGFGFPPKIASWKRGETKYSVNALPFGGFVRLFGEDHRETGTGSFRSVPVGRRLAIVLAGVFMNLILAILILTVGFSVGTTPLVSDPASLGGIDQKQVVILDVLPDSVADQAGLRSGDVLLGFDSAEEIQRFTRSHRGETVTLRVDGTRDQGLTVTLGDAPDAPLGVHVTSVSIVKLPLHRAFLAAVRETGSVIQYIARFVVGFFTNLSTRQEISEQAVGPVGIYFITEKAVEFGATYVLQLVALLSINLAVINILPFPALDGGRAFFLAAEGIFGKGVLQPRYEGIIHTLGFAILVTLLLVLTYRDIVRFF